METVDRCSTVFFSIMSKDLKDDVPLSAAVGVDSLTLTTEISCSTIRYVSDDSSKIISISRHFYEKHVVISNDSTRNKRHCRR